MSPEQAERIARILRPYLPQIAAAQKAAREAERVAAVPVRREAS